MHTKAHSIPSVRIPSSAIVAFLGFTFAITWGLIGVYIMAPEMAAVTFGEISGSHPFFFLATWSPAIAAFVVVFLSSGASGIRAFLAGAWATGTYRATLAAADARIICVPQTPDATDLL